jgi:hypothetical protein
VRAWLERGGSAGMSAFVARATAWLVEPREGPEAGPAHPGLRPRPPAPASEPPRPVVVVLGLSPRAGASTVARALAARLARHDPAGVAVLFTDDPPRAPISATAAARLARAAVEAGCDHARAVGRLCVLPAAEPVSPLAARRAAPLVVDPGHGAPAEGVVALADHVVLVSTADVEPALVEAVESSLRGADRAASLVVSRLLGDPPAALEDALAIPESRLAAQLTLAAREPRGALGAVVAELAERSLAEARG